MTELDEVLAEVGALPFDGKQFDNGEHSVEIGEIRPQTNGLLIKLYGRHGSTAGGSRFYSAVCGGLLKPGQERIKLLRELAAAWEEVRIRSQNIPISLSKPKGEPFLKPGRLRRGEVTEPVSASIEAFVKQILGNRVDASQLVYDRSIRLIRQTFEQIQADISYEEVTRIWNEVYVSKVQLI